MTSGTGIELTFKLFQVVEEDYQRKYFQLLNAMNDLQDKFLLSQRNFEDLIKGNIWSRLIDFSTPRDKCPKIPLAELNFISESSSEI